MDAQIAELRNKDIAIGVSSGEDDWSTLCLPTRRMAAVGPTFRRGYSVFRMVAGN